jgi:serine/threonine-protein kinase RsbW
VTASLPATRRAVTKAIALSRRFSEGLGLPADTADTLALVVEEWLMNVVEHGDPAEDGPIDLIFERHEGFVRLTITDMAAAFDPRGATSDGPNEERGGGAGLALIHAWATIRSYQRTDGRNRVEFELKA